MGRPREKLSLLRKYGPFCMCPSIFLLRLAPDVPGSAASESGYSRSTVKHRQERLEHVVHAHGNAGLLVLAGRGDAGRGCTRACANCSAGELGGVDVSIEVGALGQCVGSADDAQLALAIQSINRALGFIVGSGQSQCRSDVVGAASPVVFGTGLCACHQRVLLVVSIADSHAEWAGRIGATDGPVFLGSDRSAGSRHIVGALGVRCADGERTVGVGCTQCLGRAAVDAASHAAQSIFSTHRHRAEGAGVLDVVVNTGHVACAARGAAGGGGGGAAGGGGGESAGGGRRNEAGVLVV